MSALPRGRCPACGGDVALRVNGSVREHRVYLSQLEQDIATRLGRTRVCEGSGRPAEGGRFRSASIPGAAFPGDTRYVEAHPGLASGDS